MAHQIYQLAQAGVVDSWAKSTKGNAMNKDTIRIISISLFFALAAGPVFAAWTVDADNGAIHDGEIEITIGPDAAHDGGIVLKKVRQAPKGDWTLDSLPRIEADTGLRPTAIDGSFVAWNSGLRSFALPDTVRSIGRAAFFACENATNTLALPSNLETLGRAAFMGCKNLRGNLVIPAGVRVIEMETFYGCSGLTGLAFAQGSRLKHIDTLAFKRCGGLRGTRRRWNTCSPARCCPRRRRPYTGPTRSRRSRSSPSLRASESPRTSSTRQRAALRGWWPRSSPKWTAELF